MSDENNRLLRINEIIMKNENEIDLLNRFLENPFSRGEYYKSIKKSQSYLEDNSKGLLSIIVWVMNIVLWGILIVGFSNIKKLLIEGIIFAIFSVISIYLATTVRLIIFSRKRKKELEELILINKNKL